MGLGDIEKPSVVNARVSENHHPLPFIPTKTLTLSYLPIPYPFNPSTAEKTLCK